MVDVVVVLARADALRSTSIRPLLTVTVNAVAPGPTATELFLDGKDERTVAALAAQPPLERLGTPADIARVVAFLSSPQGHWVNGQVVRANGGIV